MGHRRPPGVLRPATVVALALVSACGAPTAPTVEDAWVRPTPPGADEAAFYLVIHSGGGEDVLTGLSSDRCASVELHTTSTVDGVMRMRPADDRARSVPDGGDLVLEPAGLHAMCLGLTASLVEGDEIPVVLHFAGAGPVGAVAVVEQR